MNPENSQYGHQQQNTNSRDSSKTERAAKNPTILDRIYPLGFRDEALIIVKNSIPLVIIYN